MTGLQADLVDPPLIPGSPEWHREITASKVSAILGLSPWKSRFAQYYDMAGLLPPVDMTTNQARGHWLEDAIARWFADQHGVHLRPGKCWRSREHPWMVVTPDRLIFPHRYGRQPQAVLEIKTSGSNEEWGPDGSDEIPPHYRVQIMLQLDCLGLPVGYCAVLLSRLQFRSYTIRHDPDEAAWIRQEVLKFRDTLPGGPNEQVPDIDEDDSTYQALRAMHPNMEDRDVPISPELARRFIETKQHQLQSKAAWTGMQSEMAQVMGSAKRAVLIREGQDPLVIATRKRSGSGDPYVAAPQTLPPWEALLV